MRFRAPGKSMRPAILDGDVLIVAPIQPDAIKRGDIILYQADEHIIAHRVIDGSRCAYTCHARAACPAGSAHRYGEDQIRYFYGKSLDTIKAYLARR